MNLQEQQDHFDMLAQKARNMMLSKGNDYSNLDRLSNFKLAGTIAGLTAQQNCLSLIATKVARLGVLLQPGKVPNNEAAMDSIEDLFNYAALLHMLESESKPEQPTCLWASEAKPAGEERQG